MHDIRQRLDQNFTTPGRQSEPPILLVEDNPDDIALTLRMLRRARVQNDVVVAVDGVEALAYLLGTSAGNASVASPPPALVLLDLRLPRLDGVDVLRRIRAAESTRDLPVVIFTSDSGERDLVETAALGIHAFARKPLDFMELVDTLGAMNLSMLLMDGSAASRALH